MTEIHDRLRELGERMSVWAPDEVGLGDSAHRSIMRRRRAVSLAGGAAASALVVVSTLGIAALAGDAVEVPTPAASASFEGEGAAAPSSPLSSPSEKEIDRDEFFGSVWPEDSRQETSQGCSAAAPDSFRGDALDTALEFARAVLGWHAAEGVVGGEHRNSVQIELRRAGPGLAAVNVSMVEYAPDCWSVQSVDPLGSDVPLPLMWNREVAGEGGSQTNVISFSFDEPDGAGGRIELEYGEHRANRRFTAGDVSMAEPLVFRLGAIDPYDAGHAVILFEDDQGRVETAVGVYLLPQKGLARADGLP